jgi:carboxymethylenebutenolidase
MTNILRKNSSRLLTACLAIAALALATQVCAAQDWAKTMLAKSPRHGEYVVIKEASGRNLQAFVVYPEVKEKAPVIVLIHEIFGESDWFKEMADELAGAGYIVIAPDLLSGFGPAPTAAELQAQKPKLERVSMDMDSMDHSHMDMDMQMGQASAGAPFVPASPGGTDAFAPNQVTKAVSALPEAQVLTDLDAAADYGKKLPSANGKLFVAGFCWGGTKSFLYATHRHDLSAAFVFYGTPPTPDAMKNITAPVYGFYAGNDARVSATIPQAVIDMKAAGKKYEPVVYDGAGHGFMRAGQAPAAAPNQTPEAFAANVTAWNEGFKRMLGQLSASH